MYLSNGLQVLSVRIPAIESSKVGKNIFFYDSQDPKNIADAVVSITSDNKINPRILLNDLNNEFIEDLKLFLEA